MQDGCRVSQSCSAQFGKVALSLVHSTAYTYACIAPDKYMHEWDFGAKLIHR